MKVGVSTAHNMPGKIRNDSSNACFIVSDYTIRRIIQVLRWANCGKYDKRKIKWRRKSK